MTKSTGIVRSPTAHTLPVGEAMPMERKYDATYKFGNTVVHIVAPPPMTQEEIDRILDEYHAAGWAIFDRLRKEKDSPGAAEGERGR